MSGQITEIFLHEIVIYLSIELYLFCSFVQKATQTIKIASFLGIRGEGQQKTRK